MRNPAAFVDCLTANREPFYAAGEFANLSKPEIGFAGSVQTFNISTVSVGFRDRDGDRKVPELPHRHDGVTSCHVYECDLQRSSGERTTGDVYEFEICISKMDERRSI